MTAPADLSAGLPATLDDTARRAVLAWPGPRALAAWWGAGLPGHPARLLLAEPGPPVAIAGASALNERGSRRLVALPYDWSGTLLPRQAAGPARFDRPLAFELSGALELGGPEVSPAPEPRGVLAAEGFELGALRSPAGRSGYTAAAARAVEYIQAGDVYQVNLAHELRAPFRGSARALFAHIASRARPLHGAYLEWDVSSSVRVALLSFSPELFLELDAPGRRVISRPMKGTRPGGGDPGELRRSVKDRAELNMIVDLMRNDLGRVATPGSVRVERPRDIESHGGARGVLQATATVAATLRPGLGLGDALGACFPPGSVTGAPKVRACQIIRELELFDRGFYCGSLGLIEPDGSATLSVAIRTATIVGRPDPARADGFLDAELSYPVGAGIVADSDPEAEWRETLVKAGPMLHATRLETGACRLPPAERSGS